MTDADRQQISELASLLTTYFANQRQTCLLVSTSLSTWLQQAHDLQDTFAVQGFTNQARRMTELITPAEDLIFAIGCFHETARMAQQHLDTLLTVASMKGEEQP